MPRPEATPVIVNERCHLYQIRHARQLTKDKLHQLSGVSTVTIWMIERFDHNPLYDTKRRLAKALQLKVSDIWPEETDD